MIEKKTKKAWTVLTPAGEIYYDLASDARNCHDNYGYHYFKTPKHELNDE